MAGWIVPGERPHHGGQPVKRRAEIQGDIRGEDGFTLIEALVATMVMLIVFFALHSIFEAGVRAVSLGRDETEAVGRARLGMERMERDLRSAISYTTDNADNDGDEDGRHLFFDYGTPSESQMPQEDALSFGNDLDGECGLREAGTGETCGDVPEPRELISYYVNDSRTLIRRSNSRSPLVEDVSELRLTYFDAEGNPATTEGEIRRVDLSLTVAVGDAEQTLTGGVALRSRTR